MIWDAKSTGTLSNVIELLSNERSSRVFVNKNEEFFTVLRAKDLDNLIAVMSSGARAKAETKIGLTAKVEALTHKQYRMPL
jgi:hypothetical protein